MTGPTSAVRSVIQRLLFHAGVALVTRSGDSGSKEWAEYSVRAVQAELADARSTVALQDERRRSNHLFTACTLAYNLIASDKVVEAQQQLRLAIIAGRKRA